uniref:Uncharacterized protein n=1 Tax=Molossus molossus TaxID=27622 RepID=A0A7J8DC87_MOLMO|nr:hypothetical protein HJG59_009374 [Molossus molossus]
MASKRIPHLYPSLMYPESYSFFPPNEAESKLQPPVTNRVCAALPHQETGQLPPQRRMFGIKNFMVKTAVRTPDTAVGSLWLSVQGTSPVPRGSRKPPDSSS